MKLHSGWLAAALLLFAVLACNLSKNNNNSNNSNNKNSNSNKPIAQPTRAPNADVFVEKISLAKDENGEAGESTTTFEPSDSKIHCVITLNKAKAGTKIRTVWIAVDVAGTKNDEIKTLDYTTNSLKRRSRAL